MTNPYPPEPYNPDDRDYDSDLPMDDGTMQDNVDALAGKVVGHRIVSAVKEPVPGGGWHPARHDEALVLTLDDGTRVVLRNQDDCCAETYLDSFLLHPEKVDHIITGVGTTDGFTKWHIYADFGDVLELEVGWSCGNPFYYGYGFDIFVVPVE